VEDQDYQDLMAHRDHRDFQDKMDFQVSLTSEDISDILRG
jgi:hypothetical protein